MISIQLIFVIMCLVLAIVFATIFTIRRGKKTDEVSLILKVAASLCFIFLGIAGAWHSGTPMCLAVVAALILGLLGDFFLDMKFVYPKSDFIYTICGFISFMIGHIFYLVYMLRSGFSVLWLLISIAVGIIAGIAIYATPKLMKLDYGKFRVISSVYAGLLVFVTVLSLTNMIFVRFTVARLLMFIGLLFFLISDLILSQIYFGKDKNTTANKVANHATYYFAQIVIAFSLIFVIA